MENPMDAFVSAWLLENETFLQEIVDAHHRAKEPRSFESTFVADLKKATGCDA
jgi:hypothetical protein